jgi:hypothetical protein
MLRKLILPGVVLAAAVSVAGCFKSASDDPKNDSLGPAPAVKSGEHDQEHAHKPGQHGGRITNIGQDNYHAEVVIEKGGTLRLHILGKDETKIQEVEVQELTAYLQGEGDTEAMPVVLKAEPQADDAMGKTSQFAGQLPAALQGRTISGSAHIRIAGQRYRFSIPAAGDEHADAAPPKVVTKEEKELFLTPGGIYTAEDIKANGNQTASQKFAKFKPAHDRNPKPGEKICPITRTKANPACTWIVGGKTYTFCCPPCVSDFLKLAKEAPERIKEPAAYVQPK